MHFLFDFTFIRGLIERPRFGCIKMRVTAQIIAGIEGMGEKASWSVEWRIVAVLAIFKRNANVGRGKGVGISDLDH